MQAPHQPLKAALALLRVLRPRDGLSADDARLVAGRDPRQTNGKLRSEQELETKS